MLLKLKNNKAKIMNNRFDLTQFGQLQQNVPSLYDLSHLGAMNKEEKNSPQLQEEYSNPSNWPGFSDLSKEEKIQRIMYSQWDPANQSPTGGYVPPGTYESKAARMAASSLVPLLVPGGSSTGALTEGWGNTGNIINALAKPVSNITGGTLSNIAYESPNIKNSQDLSNVTKNAGLMNAVLETIPFAGRALSSTAELFNPTKYMSNKMDQIKDEAQNVKSIMDSKYAPINEKYGDSLVTLDPEKYMQDMGISRNKLYQDSKLSYDEFLKKPNYSNLKDLQTQVARSYSTVASNINKPKTAQLFNFYQNNLRNGQKQFLSRDPEALNQFNDATNYARENYYPYLSSPDLRKVVSKGSDANVSGNSLINSIKKTMDKKVGNRDVLPETHPLVQHLTDMQNRKNLGNLSKSTLPTITGSAIGYALGHPELGATAGAGLTTGMLSSIGNSILENTIQNPLAKKLAEHLTHAYYGAGRAGINLSNQ
jgi:hypothetical protein